VSDKKKTIIFGASSAVIAIGLGTLIYFQHEKIEERRTEAEVLRSQIAADRKLIESTPGLVKDVIIQRETDTVIREILSDEEDVNNFVRTLESFAKEAGITFSSYKKQRVGNNRNRAAEFEKVAYQLAFDADAFQLLTFLSRVESHARFISVTDFKLTAAPRQQYEDGSDPRHRIQLNLETYKYNSTGENKEVKIDRYEHKRDLLISEISKRTSELRVPVYSFKGRRGRRDPWIDPRIPVDPDGPQLSIPEQIAIVEDLIDRTEVVKGLWREFEDSGNLVARMKARANLEDKLILLEEEVRRVESEGQISFVTAVKRFENKVVKEITDIREQMTRAESGNGPSTALLRETAETMERHIAATEYELALAAYQAIEGRVAMAERDPLKKSLIDGIKELKLVAETVIAFEAIDLDIRGVAIYEDRRPVALINGQALSEGELVGNELIIHSIREDLIEFNYRGLILGRVLDADQPKPR